MQTAILVLFIGIVAGIIGALLYYGRKWSAQIKRADPDNMLNARLRPSGIVLSACFTAVLVLFAAAFTLTPESPLGAFLRSPKGILSALVSTIAAFSLVGYALERVGSKPFVNGRDDC